MPVPTVFATCRPNTANAMKLKNAAQTTAVLGLSTRVDTTVAIELAASCSPFMKSKSSATPTRPNTTNEPSAIVSTRREPLHVLRRDRLDDVRDVVALVDDALDKLVELLAIEIADGVERAAAELDADAREPRIERFVGGFLDVPDALAQREDRLVIAGDRVEMRHHLLQQIGAFDDRIDHRLHFLGEGGDRIALNPLGGV